MAMVECRKFAPNIFNKSKCSACFRLKEDHSASAIELNKASRKISKCGYLFVAPDWDFSNPVNRTKRWQRRWFVLYDDGELTYSVDDHPETIPQACIDMNKVMEVARADEVTGNPFSVAITAPDRVHFVKGTCKEESTWWLEVLQIFPRSSIKTGRAKRNATFPGGISTTYMAQYSGSAIQTPPVKGEAKEPAAEEKEVVQEVPVKESAAVPLLVSPPPTARPRERLELESRSEGNGRYKKIKSKEGLREGTRAYRSLRSNTCENLSAIPAEYARPKSRYAKQELEEPEQEVVAAAAPQPVIQIDCPPSPEEPVVASPPSSPPAPSPPPQSLPARGVPDGGCATLDSSLTASPAKAPQDEPLCLQPPTIPVPSPHELLNCKKGWLMKQSPGKDWQKHWFVLQGSALMYFRDPGAENNGLLDGIIDLGLVQKVDAQDVARNYGFIVSTLDERQYVLSAVTHGIRNNWISALRTAANLALPPETDTPKLARRETIESLDTTRISRRAAASDLLRSSSPSLPAEVPACSSPPLARTPTSRVKKERRAGGRSEASRLKTSHSLSVLPLTGLAREEPPDCSAMVPERDTGVEPPVLEPSPSLVSLSGELTCLQSQLESSQAELLGLSNGSSTGSSSLNESNSMEGEVGGEASMKMVKLSFVEATDTLHRQSHEIGSLRKKLDNMNSDMDATLKNLNDEHIRNNGNVKKIQDLEQANGLLQIKSSNSEKSLREQSKEITSLNGRVKEFCDLSSQYKAQIVENKTLRQKLERLERMREGPNWKALYEGLQEQHSKERELWEGKLHEMEQEMHEMQDTNNETQQKAHIITDLSHQLQESEQRINQLVSKNDSLERDHTSLKSAYEDQISGLKENIKELEEYIDKTDTDKNESESSKDSEIMRLREEVVEKSVLEKEVESVRSQLAQTEAEVESLTRKMLEAGDSLSESRTSSRSLCSSQPRLPRMDSLTELMAPAEELQAGMEHEKLLICYNDVMKRLSKAITEIKALRTSVKTSQNSADEMELVNIRLQQSLVGEEAQHSEALRQMSTKIEDLTGKYLAAERQVRSLKVKGAEGKGRRRSSTGIRPEEFLVNKEAEHVLDDIELNLTTIEGMVRGKEPTTKEGRRKSYETSTKASRARRRSSECTELTFVDRLKKTEKTITELNRKLSTQVEPSSAGLEALRRQVTSAVSKCRAELGSCSDAGMEEVDRLLTSLDSLASIPEVPVISVLEPAFPKSEDLSSHLDTVMSFLFKCVETSYQLRKEVSGCELSASKVVSLYEVGAGVEQAAELARAMQSQETSLQAYLLLDLQQQIANSQTKFFAYERDQTMREYDLVTKTLLLKMLESKQFVPLSSYTSQKMAALGNISLGPSNLETMFRRLQAEAHRVFANIGSLTQDLISVLTDAVSCDVSNKESIVENIKSEVLNMIEDDERFREFQTGVVSIFLIASKNEVGRDPERVNLMANREDALQSQAEVARILIDQEIQDLANAIDVKIECMEKDSVFLPTKEFPDVDNLSQCVFKISSMMAHKCIAEAQITILNTILGCSETSSLDDEGENMSNNFVFNPENMESECNEFMLVLNNYRQQSSHGSSLGSSLACPKYSSASNGEMLESNLKSIRKENESKKARLSAALEDQRVDTEVSGLRSWCEKSMTAMEKSYESLLHDLQTQHSKEKDSLKREKETALAEETQATLAALDAMRKAHESEVQKEVEKFKKEFLSEYQSKACIGALQSEYGLDRAEIKREILSITSGESWEQGPEGAEARPAQAKLTRSPSCPRLYSSLSLSTAATEDTGSAEEAPLRSPLSGMVANRKRVFESDC